MTKKYSLAKDRQDKLAEELSSLEEDSEEQDYYHNPMQDINQKDILDANHLTNIVKKS